MSLIRLYLDEDSQDQALLRSLRARNIDVITVKETQAEGLLDAEQLRLATQQQRVIYSHNISDFYQLHTEFVAGSENHAELHSLPKITWLETKFEPF